MDRVAVRNAADPQQVRRAGRKDGDRRDQELADLRSVLALAEGRRVVWRLLEHCRVFESIWDPSSRIHANAGRQDVGHYLMAEVAAADEDRFFEMMREAREAKAREAAATEGARTPSATQEAT